MPVVTEAAVAAASSANPVAEDAAAELAERDRLCQVTAQIFGWQR